MNDLLKVLQSGDLAGLELEKARAAVDVARATLEESRVKFEFSKQAFEDVVQAAEEAGLPRAKFKKLIEERTAGLWTSGLVGDIVAGTPRAAKTARAPKKKSEEVATESFSEADLIDCESATAPEVELVN
jgi:hypothetical protein